MLPAADNTKKKTFKKYDKLKSSLEIETLYRKNHFFVAYPLKCYYNFSDLIENKSTIQSAFTVPKKTFKHAVNRNTLKRRMREAYRLHYKTIFETLTNQKDKQLKLFFIYIGKESLAYDCIAQNMQLLLQKIRMAF